jgi:hypothetical protein
MGWFGTAGGFSERLEEAQEEALGCEPRIV